MSNTVNSTVNNTVNNPGNGVVYTETVVYSPPEAYVNDVPYQLAIVELEGGRRLTARIEGDRAHIGDRVSFVQFRNEVPFFQKTA
jgi:uncharacterized OB-fold protein